MIITPFLLNILCHTIEKGVLINSLYSCYIHVYTKTGLYRNGMKNFIKKYKLLLTFALFIRYCSIEICKAISYRFCEWHLFN